MADTDTFVAREGEMARLSSYLRQALVGEGQICFVTGEAGSGKTALVQEFTRRAQEKHAGLVTAFGQCDAQTGIGDAYLPFREVLDLLTGDVDTKLQEGAITKENAQRLRGLISSSAEVLMELGPDLLELFVPWAGLAVRLSTFAAEKSGLKEKLERRFGSRREPKAPQAEGIDQSQVFEQYANVLRALSSVHPLLIVLDDLQWADASSIELLFHLSRRMGSASLLLIGTYRPDEVALGRGAGQHPLNKVMAEMKRYRGDIWIDLDHAQATDGRQFVDALLDREPNRLDETFRSTLLEHAGGNALFTVELLREMEQRGAMVRDETGRWVEGPALDWDLLPARIEGVICERIMRLNEKARESLTVGSVEGSEFTAEVVADVLHLEPRALVRRFSGELDREQRVIESQGTRRLGGQRLSRYAFKHHLFQQYLYRTLDEIERAYLHEDVGNALEVLYGDEADEIAVQLARHFVAADLADKARRYLRLSGERAAARYAHEEAEAYLTRALQFAARDAPEERYAILLTREQVFHLRGERDLQRRDLEELEALARELEDTSKKAQVALRAARYAETVSHYSRALEESQTAIELARASDDTTSQAAAYLQSGRIAWHQGDHDASRSKLQRALTLAREGALRPIEGDCLNNLGMVSWYQGRFDPARRRFKEALSIKRQSGDRLGEGHVLMNLAGVAYEQGQYAEATACQSESLRIYRAVGYRRGEAMALCNLSVFLMEQGEYDRARARLEECMPIYQEIDDQQGVVASHIALGIIAIYVGSHDDADRRLQDALLLSRQIGDRRGEIEALIYLSLLAHHVGDDEAARTQGEEALRLARASGDLRNCAHALTHLGHALAGLGHLQQAAEAYGEAIDLRRESGEQHRAVESLAGMARVSLAQEDQAEALSHVEEILDYLSLHTLDGTDEPFEVYLTCYQVLRVNDDDRVRDVLLAAEKLFNERLRNLGEPELRRSFTERVPAHRRLAREWENQTLPAGTGQPGGHL
jgi:tetratricopeptide (TPR) repeat protein